MSNNGAQSVSFQHFNFLKCHVELSSFQMRLQYSFFLLESCTLVHVLPGAAKCRLDAEKEIKVIISKDAMTEYLLNPSKIIQKRRMVPWLF